MAKTVRNGLSLAGGGLKSFSQLAALETFEKHGIPIDALTGASMGAVIACLYACDLSLAEIEELLLEGEKTFGEIGMLGHPLKLMISSVGDRNGGLVDSGKMEQFLEDLFGRLGVRKVSDIKRPVGIPAVNFNSGSCIIFTNEPELFRNDDDQSLLYPKDISIATALAAGCAFPLIFSPVKVDGMNLLDGGVLYNQPINLFNRGALDHLIGVSMMADFPADTSVTPFQVALQSLNLVIREMDRRMIPYADLHINFPFAPELMFRIGTGKEVIEKARKQMQEEPIKAEIIRRLSNK